MEIKQNIPLKNLNTFKAGGNADYFCEVKSVDELKKAIEYAKENKLSVFILGGGSNILVSDSGFEGLVVKIELKSILFEGEKLIAGAGEDWDKVVNEAVQKKLYGIENLSFIPGSVGAGVAGNIGAYGSEIKDVLEYVEVLDTDNLKTTVIKNKECEFDYRNSIFKKKKNYIVTKACFKLSQDRELNLSYKDVKKYFKDNKTPTLKEIRSAIGKIRKEKFPNLKEIGTAGSFFKNPIIEGEKIHLAKILDDIGVKGLKKGSVGLYENQSLVVINYGDASAKEIKNFSDKIANKVFKKEKIKITPEIIFVGKF
ncbi:MAG: UDP-N-acetylmuramate dehydrogenase [Candidatus Paceibacteria bacterium]